MLPKQAQHNIFLDNYVYSQEKMNSAKNTEEKIKFTGVFSTIQRLQKSEFQEESIY